MLDLKEKGFAAKLFSGDEANDSNKGPSFERALATATNLRLWDKTGHLAAGLSWSSYVADEWDAGGSTETLTLLFASRYVVLHRHHLLSPVHQIDEGRLRHITETDGTRTMEFLAENASIRDGAQKIPIVMRFEVRQHVARLSGAQFRLAATLRPRFEVI